MTNQNEIAKPDEQELKFVLEDNTSGVISIDDVADQYDPNTSMRIEQSTRNPFAGYPSRIIEARFYPRNPILDNMTRDDLLQYCVRNELFHKEWIIQKGIPPNAKDQHEKVLSIRTEWKKEKILSFIDRKQTHRFPSHYLVFCNLPPTKPGLARSIPVKSWITRRFRSVWFDMSWPLPTPEDPYRKGEPNKCAIVDDDSMRAQLFFIREPKSGKVVQRQLADGIPAFHLLTNDAAQSLPILRRIFVNGTKGSPDLQAWEKEFGLPEMN